MFTHEYTYMVYQNSTVKQWALHICKLMTVKGLVKSVSQSVVLVLEYERVASTTEILFEDHPWVASRADVYLLQLLSRVGVRLHKTTATQTAVDT